MGCGLKQLLRTPGDLGGLAPEHRNMAISSLSQLITASSSALTGLLTSTAKELNTFGGHADTSNAIIVGISFIMAQPPRNSGSNPFVSSSKKGNSGGRLFFGAPQARQ